MLKLKKSVREFLKANVKPDCLEWSIKNIEADASLHGCANHWRIAESQSIHGVRIDFDLSKDCFEEVDDLVPHRWYKKEDFDGNPKNYWIIERYKYGGLVLTSDPMYLDSLEDQTNHFMLVEPFDEAKDDAS